MGKKIVGVRKRGKRTFEIRYYDLSGARQHETIKADTTEDAAKIRESRIGSLAQGVNVTSAVNTVCFEELAADVVNDYIVNEHTSKRDIEMRFRVHLNPVFGKHKAASITTAAIRKYIIQRKAEGAAIGSINREMEAMRRAFNLALQDRKILSAPHVPKLDEDNVREGFFSREEVDRLVAALKEPYASFTRFGFLTGWRIGEIRELTWRNIDFAASEIRINVGDDKNRDGRVFPMCPELRSLLEKRKTTSDSLKLRAINPYVFWTIRKPAGKDDGWKRAYPIGEFKKTWKAAIGKAGLPCVKSIDGKRVVKALRTFHDLRRSAAREFQRQGFTEGQIMRMCGWKTRSVFDRYNIVTHADIREKMAALASGGKSGGNSQA